jgi:putative Mn2+ efflux pump MntP
MFNRPPSYFCSLTSAALLALALASTYSSSLAEDCPTDANPIATDRPDVTNSSLVVPMGSLQAENGIDWTVRHGSNALDGTNTRLRLGVAHCAEFVLDVPSYTVVFNGSQPSGFSNTVVSFKRQLPVPFGFDLSATAGLGFPSGSPKIVGQGYQPYIQFPWSHPIAEHWEVLGMFTVPGFPAIQPETQLSNQRSQWRGNSGGTPTCLRNMSGNTTTNVLFNFLMAAVPGGSPKPSSSTFTLVSASTAALSITTSASATLSASIIFGERPLEIHRDLVILAKSFAVALAVGLDVLAVSVGVGVTRLAFDASIRVGCAFAGSEIAMQVIGYALGSGAGRIFGVLATYVGLVLLAAIGGMMIRNSFRDFSEPAFDATRGTGLVMTSLSISLDSLGVGIALPAVGIPLLPLLIIVSITTTVFTFVGLAFGARMGERYERSAERTAGALLMLLASSFAIEHFV